VTQIIKRPMAVRAAAKQPESSVAGFMRHSGCTLEQAQRRVGKAELSGTTITRNGVEYKFR
jgi:hypothetical protein